MAKVLQMFIRDPANNLIEISGQPGTPVDEAIFADDLVEAEPSLFVSERNDRRGLQTESATLYHDRAK